MTYRNDAQVYLVSGGAWCYLPSPHIRTTPWGAPGFWRVPRDDVDPRHRGRATVAQEEMAEAAERGALAPLPEGRRGRGRPRGSGASSSTTRDTADVTGMTSSLEAMNLSLQGLIRTVTDFQSHVDTRFDRVESRLENVERVLFHQHRANVNAGYAPPFPNHPQYPPAHNFTPGYWQEPAHFAPPSDPGTSMPPPPPGDVFDYGPYGDPCYGFWGPHGGGQGGNQGSGPGNHQGGD